MLACKTTGTSTERGLLSSLWNIPAITGHVTYAITRITNGPPIARADISTPSKSVCCFPIMLIVSMVTSSCLLSKTCLNGSYYFMSQTIEIVGLEC